MSAAGQLGTYTVHQDLHYATCKLDDTLANIEAGLEATWNGPQDRLDWVVNRMDEALERVSNAMLAARAKIDAGKSPARATPTEAETGDSNEQR